MKRFRFALALLFAGCSAAGSVAAACDHCRTHTCKCSCKQDCDDRGLLGVVDRMAGNIQSGIKRSLPKIELEADLKLFRRGKACDSAEDTCGCELKPAATCGCESHPGGPRPLPAPALGRSSAPIHESTEAPPLPRMLSPGFNPALGGDPGVPPKPRATPLVPRSNPSESQPSRPVSVPPGAAGETLQDSQVDPFQDDATASLYRQRSATPVTYERRVNRYVDSYDPQAFSVYRVKLIDTATEEAPPASAPASEVTTASADVPSASSSAGISSRRRAGGSTIPGAPSRPASLQQANTTTAPRPIDNREATRPSAGTSAAADYYANPLR